MKSADEILICDHIMKTSEQYFPVFRNSYYAYKAIPIFGIFENIQRDHSFEVLLKFSHLIPFPSVDCKIYFLTLDLIGSKSEININTKNTITWTSCVSQ